MLYILSTENMNGQVPFKAIGIRTIENKISEIPV